jgi:hypothetical protein
LLNFSRISPIYSLSSLVCGILNIPNNGPPTQRTIPHSDNDFHLLASFIPMVTLNIEGG